MKKTRLLGISLDPATQTRNLHIDGTLADLIHFKSAGDGFTGKHRPGLTGQHPKKSGLTARQMDRSLRPAEQATLTSNSSSPRRRTSGTSSTAGKDGTILRRCARRRSRSSRGSKGLPR